MKNRNMFVIVIMMILILSPVDLVPDMIPLLGHADDLIYLLVMLAQVFRKGGGKTNHIERQ